MKPVHERIFLACSPRTGNLWIRRIVAQALNMPVFVGNNPGEIDWAALPDRCLVAMHWRYSVAFETFLRERGFKVMVTTRHPLDVLVSILHFSARNAATARWLEGECGTERPLAGATPDSEAFEAYCVSPRAEALLSVSLDWRHAADAIVRYEDVLASPVTAVRDVLERLEATPQTAVEEAAAANSFGNIQAVAGQHAWRGHAGDWRRVITAALARRVFNRHRAYFEAFGYAADAADNLTPGQAYRHWLEMAADQVPPPAGDTSAAADLSDIDELKRQVEAIRWFHRIDLGRGIVTPGQDIDGQAKIAFSDIPADLAGKTVLDVGAWDGLFSFEAEKRGAARVLATDSFAWSGGGWGSKAGFELARRALRSRVEDLTIDVMELEPSKVGIFDVVFFLGILYHLRHPFLALEKVAAVTRERLILSTWVDLTEIERPAGAFYPKGELAGDVTNWWGLNPACVTAMLQDVGFHRVSVVSSLNEPGPDARTAFPMAFHAWK